MSSVITNALTISQRKAHIQLLQETLVAPSVVGKYKLEAKGFGKVFEAGPLDPEQNKAAAGVGLVAAQGLRPYKLPSPTKDFQDAEATGRCAMCCIDLAGNTPVIAVIYGWAGGTKGTPEAARTDDIISIVQTQMRLLDPGPKLIAADLNGTTDAFPTLREMLAKHEWFDVGDAEDKGD